MFAGMTVGIALLGMLALGVSLLSGAGIASSVVVAFAVLAALTLLPALLGFFGPRTLTRRARRGLAAGELRASDESPTWARWAAILQGRPALFAAGAAALMLIITVPLLSMRVGSADAGSDPASSTTRQAYDLLARASDPASTSRCSSSPRSAPPVSSSSSTVFPTGSPQAALTSDLLTNLRTSMIPRASNGQVHVLVGGQTAVFADFSSVLSAKPPLFIGVVVLLSFILLMAVFRSLAIPLMATVMNLLSVGAASGWSPRCSSGAGWPG